MRNWRRAFAAVSTFCVLSGGAALAQSSPGGSGVTAAPHYGTWGYDLSAQDPSVKPGTDFYLYANGNWLERTKIPADKPSYDHFVELNDLSDAIIRKLIEDAAAGRSDDPDAAKIAAAYRAFMDEARVEALDAKPLAGDLAAIRAEKTKADVVALMGQSPKGMQSSIFGTSIGQDAKAPTRRIVYVSNGGLGLPDRDYYLKDEFAKIKEKYQVYAATLLGMIGWPDAQASAKAIVEFETRLAEATWTNVEKRDPNKTYNPMTVAALTGYAPGFDFRAFLNSADLSAVDRLVVTTDTSFPKFAKIFDATPLETLKAWQAFHLADYAAPYLSKRFVDANFDMYAKTIGGQPENLPRWKRAVGFANGVLSQSIGRMYVAKYFPPESKTKMDALVKELLKAMRARIEKVDWMGPATKAKALEKLAKMTVKIGYPSKWRDYSALTMVADDLYGNEARTEAYRWGYLLKRLNQPVDKEEWNEPPQMVNAGYGPTRNEIAFPAGILQPPFFDPTADMAVNYGGIGAVIGHEITHAFDDQGRHFDGDGALKEWWTPQDAAEFKSRADRLGAQFDKFEPIKGHFINGQLTMGENIADLGGLLLALDAYHAALGGKEPPVLAGLTGDQRLFLGWAQVWQGKFRDDFTTMLLKTNPHAPNHFRVNGPLRNIAAWYDAFKIGPGDPMYLAPEQRVRIW